MKQRHITLNVATTYQPEFYLQLKPNEQSKVAAAKDTVKS